MPRKPRPQLTLTPAIINAMTPEQYKSAERRLRRMAERQDLVLRKNRTRNPRDPGYYGYMLLDANTGNVEVWSNNGDLGLDDIEKALMTGMEREKAMPIKPAAGYLLLDEEYDYTHTCEVITSDDFESVIGSFDVLLSSVRKENQLEPISNRIIALHPLTAEEIDPENGIDFQDRYAGDWPRKNYPFLEIQEGKITAQTIIFFLPTKNNGPCRIMTAKEELVEPLPVADEVAA